MSDHDRAEAKWRDDRSPHYCMRVPKNNKLIRQFSMSRDYKGFFATPEEQKAIGERNEWELVHLLQDYGYAVGRYETREERAPRIWTEFRGYTYLPDLWAYRGGEHLLIETKRKAPNAHGAFGIPSRQVRDTRALAKEAGATPLFIVFDTSSERWLYCELNFEGMGEDIVMTNNQDGGEGYTFIPKAYFSDFKAFLEWDQAEFKLDRIRSEQVYRDLQRGIVYTYPLTPRPVLEGLDPDLLAEAREQQAISEHWEARLDLDDETSSKASASIPFLT